MDGNELSLGSGKDQLKLGRPYDGNKNKIDIRLTFFFFEEEDIVASRRICFGSFDEHAYSGCTWNKLQTFLLT